MLDEFERKLRSKNADDGLNYYETFAYDLLVKCRALTAEHDELKSELKERAPWTRILELVNQVQYLTDLQPATRIDIDGIRERLAALEANNPAPQPCNHCKHITSEPGPEHNLYCANYCRF